MLGEACCFAIGTPGESTISMRSVFLHARKSFLKTSVKGTRFNLPFFLVMKLAAVRQEVVYIIQKGAEKPAAKAAAFACILCYLGYGSSEVIARFFLCF